VQSQHGRIFAAGDGHDIAPNISVVRGLIETGVEKPISAIGQRRDCDDHAENEKAALAARVVVAVAGIAHGVSPWQYSIEKCPRPAD
jgi:hypothetical protein